MVNFIVGAEPVKQTFLVHKHLASAQSPFLKAAFDSEMVDGTTQTMRLEDVEVETFGILVHWMYKEEVKAGLGVFTNDLGKDDYDFLTLAKAWKLAGRFLMPGLRNATMADMFNNRKIASDDSVIKLAEFVYASGQVTQSNLRKFIDNLVTIEFVGPRYARLAAHLPHLLVVQASATLSQVFHHLSNKIELRLEVDNFMDNVDQ